MSLTDKKVLPLHGKLNPISSSLPGSNGTDKNNKFVNPWSYKHPNNDAGYFQPLQQNLMRATSPMLADMSPVKSDDTLESTKKPDKKVLEKKKDFPN